MKTINIKKLFKSLSFAFILLLSVVAFIGFTKNEMVYADNNYSQIVSNYTDSDNLLQPNGIPSSKTIQMFSDEVKSASIGTSFPELTQVIPSQILENSQETVSQYYGKEYGYYVVKEGDYVDVLLLDFKYEFDDGEE